MFETLKRLYKEAKIDGRRLEVAIEKGWITAVEKLAITK